MAAAQALGWQTTLLDAKLSPANYGPLIQQAISQGADGIILDAIDCSQVVAPLQQAKARGIPVVPIYAYDCNDALEKAGPSLFSAPVNFNNLANKDLGAFGASYGRDQANYVISTSNNQAKVLVVNDPEFVVLKYTTTGFSDQIAHSAGSKVVDTLNFVSADLTTPKVGQEVQAELLKHPEVNWIKSPYTFATLLGIQPAVANQPGKYKVMGGEGFQPELDLIRSGVVTATNSIDSEWTGWAAIDAMNSVFRQDEDPTVRHRLDDHGRNPQLAGSGHAGPDAHRRLQIAIQEGLGGRLGEQWGTPARPGRFVARTMAFWTSLATFRSARRGSAMSRRASLGPWPSTTSRSTYTGAPCIVCWVATAPANPR